MATVFVKRQHLIMSTCQLPILPAASGIKMDAVNVISGLLVS